MGNIMERKDNAYKALNKSVLLPYPFPIWKRLRAKKEHESTAVVLVSRDLEYQICTLWARASSLVSGVFCTAELW